MQLYIAELVLTESAKRGGIIESMDHNRTKVYYMELDIETETRLEIRGRKGRIAVLSKSAKGIS